MICNDDESMVKSSPVDCPYCTLLRKVFGCPTENLWNDRHGNCCTSLQLLDFAKRRDRLFPASPQRVLRHEPPALNSRWMIPRRKISCLTQWEVLKSQEFIATVTTNWARGLHYFQKMSHDYEALRNTWLGGTGDIWRLGPMNIYDRVIP